jgi:hypothetical protein
MRVFKALLTAAGFAATFALLFFTSAIVTAAVHKALASLTVVALKG